VRLVANEIPSMLDARVALRDFMGGQFSRTRYKGETTGEAEQVSPIIANST